MATHEEIRKLAAEVAISLLSITPGTKTVMSILPHTSKRTIRKLFGADRSATLEALIEQTLDTIASEILTTLNAKPGSHEYGATFQAIEDFRASLSKTPLDSHLIVESLTDPTIFEKAIRANCPAEHEKWASALRRQTYDHVLRRFSAAIMALAPQVPTVQTAVAIETYKYVSEIRSSLPAEPNAI